MHLNPWETLCLHDMNTFWFEAQLESEDRNDFFYTSVSVKEKGLLNLARRDVKGEERT